MQRMITGNVPRCSRGHRARHMQDMRGFDRGGGHFVECCCSHTARHPHPAGALAEWGATHAAPPESARVLQLRRAAP